MKVIIGVSEYPMVITVDPTTELTVMKRTKELVAIEALKDCRNNSTLSSSILKRERIRIGINPFHISKLFNIHKDEKPQKYRRDP